MGNQSQQLFAKTWRTGNDARKAERQRRKDEQVVARRRYAAERRRDAARRKVLIPQVKLEIARVIQQMDATEWRGAEQLKILRNAFGSFGKKLGAIRLRGEGFENILMPHFLATDGNIYMYMRSDLVSGYGKLNLHREPLYDLEKILKLLRDTST